jgi:hypothetical protein
MAAMLIVSAATSYADAAAEPDQQKAAIKTQTSCPVMGGPVTSDSQYVDVNGKRIYVCCAGCVATIKNDPDTYIKKLEDQGITLAKAPAAATETSQPACPAGKKTGCNLKGTAGCRTSGACGVSKACGASRCKPRKSACGMKASQCTSKEQ